MADKPGKENRLTAEPRNTTIQRGKQRADPVNIREYSDKT